MLCVDQQLTELSISLSADLNVYDFMLDIVEGIYIVMTLD